MCDIVTQHNEFHTSVLSQVRILCGYPGVMSFEIKQCPRKISPVFVKYIM